MGGFNAERMLLPAFSCRLEPTKVVYDSEGGTDLGIAERKVALACNIEFPRLEGATTIFWEYCASIGILNIYRDEGVVGVRRFRFRCVSVLSFCIMHAGKAYITKASRRLG